MTKILVIEDEELLRDEVVMWLTLEEYTVFEEKDGALGVETALRELPDLVICDITMPNLDGYGVLLALRATPVTARIPFIFLTAKATHEDVRQGMALGADDYVTKPFTYDEILQAVRARLQKKSKDQEVHHAEIKELQHALDHKREKQLLKAKMVAMFSHDFRNPLTAILAANELLFRYGDNLDPQRRVTFVKRIDAAGHQLLNMLDDMLIVAQMEAGKLDFNPESTNLTNFFQGIVDEFQAMHDGTHQIRYESQIAGNVLVDRRLLRQIASNLISNAVKYSPQGGEVRVNLGQYGESQFSLSVQDHGIGIPEADQQRLFSAFNRGSNVSDLPGTGLGLAIVHQAVTLHGGSITLHSQNGQGTTMRALFTLERV